MRYITNDGVEDFFVEDINKKIHPLNKGDMLVSLKDGKFYKIETLSKDAYTFNRTEVLGLLILEYTKQKIVYGGLYCLPYKIFETKQVDEFNLDCKCLISGYRKATIKELAKMGLISNSLDFITEEK